jgi:hypothetical protein
MYLVDVSAVSWAQDECEPLLNQALAARGLPPYPGPHATAGDFEEKLVPSMDDFAEMSARHDPVGACGMRQIEPEPPAGLRGREPKQVLDPGRLDQFAVTGAAEPCPRRDTCGMCRHVIKQVGGPPAFVTRAM